MILKGTEIKVSDRGGEFTFKNEVADKITLAGKGQVDLTIENLEEIFSLMKQRIVKVDD